MAETLLQIIKIALTVNKQGKQSNFWIEGAECWASHAEGVELAGATAIGIRKCC